MGTRQKRTAQKREQMLRKAWDLFAYKGFDRTSMRDLARAFGCAQSSIYSHFRSKENILYEILLNEMKRLVDMIQPLENGRDTSPSGQLRAFIERHVEFMLAQPKGKSMRFEIEMEHLSPQHRKEIILLRDVYDGVLRKIIRRGIDAGLFAKVNEKLVNYTISSTIVRTQLWYSPKGELSIAELSNAISDLFLNGLKTRAKSQQEIESRVSVSKSLEE